MWHSEAQGQISPLESQQETSDQVSHIFLNKQGDVLVGPATGQTAGWLTSCCPLGRAWPAGPGTGQPRCWKPPGAPGQGQEWGEGRTRECKVGPGQGGAPGVPDLQGPLSPGNSGFQLRSCHLVPF